MYLRSVPPQKKYNLKKSIFLLLFLSLSGAYAQSISSPTFGKGIVNIKAQDSSFTMKIGLRMQILAQSNTDLENGQFVSKQTSMKIRRARLKFDGYVLNPKLVYKIELGLSNDDMGGASPFTNDAARMILDAVVKYNFHKNWWFWAGQAKLPGNRERVISSGNLQFVNRSELNSEFNMDREAGIQIRNEHHLGRQFYLREIVSFSQGEGRNVSTGNIGGYYYIGRLELLPFGKFKNKGDYIESDLEYETTSKLAIGLTYGYNDNAVKTRSNQGRYMETDQGFYQTDISTLFIDFIYKYKAWSAMGEFAKRESNSPFAVNSDGSLTGDFVEIGQAANIQAAYLWPKHYELAFRYSSVNFDKQIGLNDLYEYTLGASKYFVGHKLKLQADISYTDTQGPRDGFRWRVQMDLHF